MNHEERLQLAHDLCARMVERYGDEILLSGIYGSTARESDTEHSDLELLFIVRDRCRAQEKHIVYRGTAVGVHVLQRRQLKDILANPSLRWPYWMGVLSALKVLHGDPAQRDTWLQTPQTIPDERFRTVLDAHLPELIVESYGRIFSCRERNNTHDMSVSALEVLMEMNLALCLLNRSWVTHDYYEGIVDTFTFPKLPANYAVLATALWSAREPDDIIQLAQTLVNNFWRLLKDEGIALREYQGVADIPL